MDYAELGGGGANRVQYGQLENRECVNFIRGGRDYGGWDLMITNVVFSTIKCLNSP